MSVLLQAAILATGLAATVAIGIASAAIQGNASMPVAAKADRLAVATSGTVYATVETRGDGMSELRRIPIGAGKLIKGGWGAARMIDSTHPSLTKPGSTPRRSSMRGFATGPSASAPPPRCPFRVRNSRNLAGCCPTPDGAGSGRAFPVRSTTKEQRSAAAQPLGGSCWTAQRLPSGSAKKMKRPMESPGCRLPAVRARRVGRSRRRCR